MSPYTFCPTPLSIRNALVLPVVVASLCIPFAVHTEVDQRRRVFTNLQVLPQDITAAELYGNMKRLTKEIGVTCSSCHRTDIRDFASDEIGAKRTARQMMRMVARINAERSAVGTLEDTKITCFTCHRGKRKPNG